MLTGQGYVLSPRVEGGTPRLQSVGIGPEDTGEGGAVAPSASAKDRDLLRAKKKKRRLEDSDRRSSKARHRDSDEYLEISP